MPRPAAFLVLPTTRHADEEPAASEAAVAWVMQSLEDLRLAEQVERALRATGHRALRNIAVSVHARVVTLSGPVPSYYLKQVAQTTARTVLGAHQVRNEVDVVRPR
jgi:osmotically-inducible protein OsmY